MISGLEASLSAYAEVNEPTYYVDQRKRTGVQIPVSDQLLSSYSSCHAADDWGDGMIFTLT